MIEPHTPADSRSHRSDRPQDADSVLPVREETMSMGAGDEFDALYGESHGDDVDDALEIERMADGVRFHLPPPGMGMWRRSGWAWLIVGNVMLIGTAIGAAIAQHFLGGAGGAGGGAGGGGGNTMPLIIIWIVAAVMVLLGLLFVDSGLSYLYGRRMIEMRGTSLVFARQGLIRVSRRLPLVRIRRLRVALAADTGDADLDDLTAALTKSMHYALYADLDNGGRKRLALWLSYEYVRALSIALARAIEQHYIANNVAVEPPVAHVDPRAVERAIDDGIERSLPEKSDVEVREESGELSIVVPKLPLFRGKAGQSVAGMLLSTLGAAGIGIFIFSGSSWIWMMFLVPAAFTWGKFMSNRIGERETYIDVVNGTLLLSHASFRGVKQHQWPRDQIRAIRRGKSDMEINDKHLPQLEIIAIDGDRPEQVTTKKYGFLVGRSGDEINWIAWRLRQALGVPAATSSEDEAEVSDDADEGDDDSWF